MLNLGNSRNRLSRALSLRCADVDDLAAVRQLLDAVGRYDANSRPTGQPAKSTLDDIAALRLSLAWLDGFLVAVAGWHTASDGQLPVMDVVAVDPMFRRLGIGRMVTSHAEAVAAKTGSPAMTASAGKNFLGFFIDVGYEAVSYNSSGVGAGARMGTTTLRKWLTWPAVAGHDPIVAPPAVRSNASHERLVTKSSASLEWRIELTPVLSRRQRASKLPH